MTENDFWTYLKDERCKGTANCVMGSMIPMGVSLGMMPELRYMESHLDLPVNYDKLPQDKIFDMGTLLFKKNVMSKTKETVLVLLAHQQTKDALFILSEYNKNPDNGIGCFAQLALDECMMWND